MNNKNKDKMVDKIEKHNSNSVLENKKEIKKQQKLLQKEKNKLLKEEKKKQRLNQRKIRKEGLVEFEVDGRKYKLKRDAFFELAKKDVKIQHKQNKVNNGEVAVLYLRDSGHGEFKYVKPENNMFVINNKYYHQKTACVFTVGKKRTPLAVIPEWSFVPISRNEHGKLLGIEMQEAQAQVIRAMETVEIVRRGDDGAGKKGTPANAKTIVLVVIIIAIAIGVLPGLLGGA